MNDIKKYRVHLMVITLLVLAKFVWVPLWESKQQQWQQREGFLGSSAKYKGLIEQEAQLVKLRQLSQQRVSETEADFESVDNLTQYKLSLQTVLEPLFKSSDVDVLLTTWRNGPVQQDVQELQLDLTFRGKLSGYLDLLSKLQQPGVYQGELIGEKFQLSTRSNALPETAINGQMTFRFRYITPSEAVQ
ncbi:hypothetical protein [Shewanella sp. FJAT-52076]|uniref:hypothetical protein n=1 Tax=Shewanella sp. FJAT-52076 TaxID=2864202 RepID=UPI001C66231C|nr:hypothetical protein [Shewanella sp. FJAT-52076]QYJ74051.1 hypothetical protein K0H79_11750 [Shewanella sp. FJAT-52076]